jgi:hypothetical protein
MKQLRWLVSISCSLLAIFLLPSQARGFELIDDASLLGSTEIFQETTLDEAIADNGLLAAAALPVAASPSLAVLPNTSQPLPEPENILVDENSPQSLDEPEAQISSSNEPPAWLDESAKQIEAVARGYQILPESEPLLRPDRLADNDQVQLLNRSKSGGNGLRVSPGLSISNPIGFGADNNIAFVAASYQSRTRGGNTRDGELGLGVGLGDAVKSVGAEISYTINSFGSSNVFGSGGFNIKLHKRINDSTAVAVGWNRFANILISNGRFPAGTDYPANSYYAVASHIIRTRDSTDDLFSRVAFSAGIGGGQFLPFSVTSTNLNAGGLNAFGSVAVRIAKPVSAIIEWTGQDLAAGLSITPFGENFPLVITPAFRDITGISGESKRFVLGVGAGFKF